MSRLNKLYMGTNTKMFKNISECCCHLSGLMELTDDISPEELELFVIPSYTSLESATRVTAGSRIRIGAQNMNWEYQGQYTGEISAHMLSELGVQLVMIGHSERRHVMGETDFEEEKKVAAAVKAGFTALLCVGETLEQKNYSLSREVLSTQLKIGLHSVAPGLCGKIMVAYEPVWAIGVNGIPADKNYANEMHGHIKTVLADLFGEYGADIPVLYGGSVNYENSRELIMMDNIDGLFIGRSAWDAVSFNKIIRQVMPLFKERKQLP